MPQTHYNYNFLIYLTFLDMQRRNTRGDGSRPAARHCLERTLPLLPADQFVALSLAFAGEHNEGCANISLSWHR